MFSFVSIAGRVIINFTDEYLLKVERTVNPAV